MRRTYGPRQFTCNVKSYRFGGPKGKDLYFHNGENVTPLATSIISQLALSSDNGQWTDTEKNMFSFHILAVLQG